MEVAFENRVYQNQATLGVIFTIISDMAKLYMNRKIP